MSRGDALCSPLIFYNVLALNFFVLMLNFFTLR